MSIVAFAEHEPQREPGLATRYARMYHLLVAWSEVERPGAELRQRSERESFVILPEFGAEFLVDGRRTAAPARSISVLPAGESTIVAGGRGAMIRIQAPVPARLASVAINAAAYREPRADLAPIDPPFRRIGAPGPRVYPLLAESSGKPQSFQTESISIGWFEKDGAEDRSAVFPHAHADFEEGSLMVKGTFVQHLRTPWGADMRAWREDEHLRCEAGTLVVIAPQTMHVAEAVGPERHVLVNLFAPPRRDHIARGQIRNADEYGSAG